MSLLKRYENEEEARACQAKRVGDDIFLMERGCVADQPQQFEH
jgi:hypothetical protein